MTSGVATEVEAGGWREARTLVVISAVHLVSHYYWLAFAPMIPALRALLDVIPLDATLVKGSHGRDRVPEDERPVLLGTTFPVKSAEDVHLAILDAARAG